MNTRGQAKYIAKAELLNENIIITSTT